MTYLELFLPADHRVRDATIFAQDLQFDGTPGERKVVTVQNHLRQKCICAYCSSVSAFEAYLRLL